jgi:hypothetical protein
MTQTIGSRRQVWNGTAKRTSGGLTKSDLMMSHGRIVSKSKHFSAKKEMRLLKYGYGTKKGKFGFVKIGTKRRHHKRQRKMKGGHSGVNMSISPAGIDGQVITNYNSLGSIGVQEAAGMAGGRRRRHSRSMYGGSGMKSFGDPGNANWNGDGIAGAGITMGDAGSANIQLLAGMAGGKRRRRHKMKGGTTKVSLSPQSLAENGSPLAAALTH